MAYSFTYIIYIIIVSLFLLLLLIIYFREKHYANIMLPRNCTFDEENMEDIIKVFRKVNCFYGKRLILDCKRVEIVSYEAFMVIIAQTEKAFHNGKSILLRNICRENVKEIMIGRNIDRATYHNYADLNKYGEQVFNASYQLNPQITVALERELRKMGIRKYYEFNTLMTELLGNAIEHGIQKREIRWWLYHFRDREANNFRVVFVDMGVGILDSYKKAGLPDKYKKCSDDELILASIKGELGSSTKQPNRGKGLPQIRRMIEKKLISNFTLITNTVSLRYYDDDYRIKKHPNFVGTYYSFTVDKQNFLRWKQLQ